MDRRLIDEKIEALRRCVKRVEEKCPASVDTLGADLDLQDILALNLSRAVQLCVDIGAHIISNTEAPPPDTMGAVFDTLAGLGVLGEDLASAMKKAVGFRNIAVHNYQAIDWEIVFSICHDNLQNFRDFAKAVALRLESS